MSTPSKNSPDFFNSSDEFEDAPEEFLVPDLIPRSLSLKKRNTFKPNFLKESNPLHAETRELREDVQMTSYSDYTTPFSAAGPAAVPSTSLAFFVHKDIASEFQQPLKKTMADGVFSQLRGASADLPNTNSTIDEANNVQTQALVDTALTSGVTNEEKAAVVPGFNVYLPLDQLAEFLEKWLNDQAITRQLSPPKQKLKRSNVFIHCVRHAQVSPLTTTSDSLLEKELEITLHRQNTTLHALLVYPVSACRTLPSQSKASSSA
jgi:hypothetical protein